MCRQRHPIVFWPAFGTSIISVEVANSSRSSCPSKGSFDVGFGQSSLYAPLDTLLRSMFPTSALTTLRSCTLDAFGRPQTLNPVP